MPMNLNTPKKSVKETEKAKKTFIYAMKCDNFPMQDLSTEDNTVIGRMYGGFGHLTLQSGLLSDYDKENKRYNGKVYTSVDDALVDIETAIKFLTSMQIAVSFAVCQKLDDKEKPIPNNYFIKIC